MIYSMIRNYVPIRTCVKLKIEGGFLIAMSEDLNIHYLNSLAMEIYLKFNGSKCIGTILDELIIEYDVDKDKVVNDLVFLLRDFQWKKLITFKENDSDCSCM